jgi:hypothetical protein
VIAPPDDLDFYVTQANLNPGPKEAARVQRVVRLDDLARRPPEASVVTLILHRHNWFLDSTQDATAKRGIIRLDDGARLFPPQERALATWAR